jgi:hypothetical protein
MPCSSLKFFSFFFNGAVTNRRYSRYRTATLVTLGGLLPAAHSRDASGG